jgi:hypothetical protein
MVARLKLKGIDGRAPPGVKQCSSASTLSNCGKVLKLQLPSWQGNLANGQANYLGTVTTL